LLAVSAAHNTGRSATVATSCSGLGSSGWTSHCGQSCVGLGQLDQRGLLPALRAALDQAVSVGREGAFGTLDVVVGALNREFAGPPGVAAGGDLFGRGQRQLLRFDRGQQRLGHYDIDGVCAYRPTPGGGDMIDPGVAALLARELVLVANLHAASQAPQNTMPWHSVVLSRGGRAPVLVRSISASCSSLHRARTCRGARILRGAAVPGRLRVGGMPVRGFAG
jgi:hypothetical protein